MSAHKIKVIYLLGTSYSGSTMLGYLLGASERVFNAGELMLFSKKKNIGIRPCFCGKRVESCEFWKHMSLPGYRLYTKPGDLTKLILLVKILFRFPLCRTIMKNRIKMDDKEFHDRLVENMQEQDNGSHIIVDTSKSIFRLIYLVCSNRFDLKVVYLKRDLLGNVSSFIKSGEGFLKGLINYKLNHFFMPRYLKQQNLDFYFLSYKNLCRQPDVELRQLGEYVGIDLSYEKVAENLNKRTFHVFTGSTTRNQFRSFQGIRYDESWRKRLTFLQQKCLQLIATKSER